MARDEANYPSYPRDIGDNVSWLRTSMGAIASA
jgi:hypothetical protein